MTGSTFVWLGIAVAMSTALGDESLQLRRREQNSMRGSRKRFIT